MKPESIQWQILSRATGFAILWCRHEDRYSPDIPDLSFCTAEGSGWVELKVIEKLPRPGKTVVIPHLKPGQVNWANARWKLGANCWMLLRVSQTDQWILLCPKSMEAILYRQATLETLLANASRVWNGVPHPTELIPALIRNFKAG